MRQFDMVSILFGLIKWGSEPITWRRDGVFVEASIVREDRVDRIGWIHDSDLQTLISEGLLSKEDIK